MAEKVPYDPLEDLKILIDYNWADEEEDFDTQISEGNETRGHIFHVLRRLNNWGTREARRRKTNTKPKGITQS